MCVTLVAVSFFLLPWSLCRIFCHNCCNLVTPFCTQLEDDSIARHAGERKVRTIDDDASSFSLASEAESLLTLDDVEEEDEAQSHGSGSDDEKDDVHGDGDKKESDDDDDGGGVDEDCDNGDEGDEEEDGAGKERGATGDDGSGQKSSASCTVEFPDTSINLTHVKGDK